MAESDSMTASRIADRTFDSHGYARKDRADRWIIAAGGIWDSVSTSSDECLMRGHTWPLGRLILVHTVDQGRRAPSRSHAAIRRDQLDHYRVVVQLERELPFDADGVRRVLKPGQMIFTDLSRPEWFDNDRASCLVLYIPRNALDDLLPRPLDLHGWMPQGPVAMLLGDHIRSLARAAPHLTTDQLPALNLATLQLLAATVTPSAATIAEARPALDAALFRQARRIIDAQLADPGLSVESLCGALKVSRTTLYRLFEPEGGVARCIRQRRLQRAHAIMSSSSQRVTIQHVADEVGFKQMAHFSRTFREHFGYSPSDVSRRALRNAAMLPRPIAGSRPFVELIHLLR